MICAYAPTAVIAGLDPAIHADSRQTLIVRITAPLHLMDARVKPGHDNRESEFWREETHFFCADAFLYQSRICTPFQCSTPSKRFT